MDRLLVYGCFEVLGKQAQSKPSRQSRCSNEKSMMKRIVGCDLTDEKRGRDRERRWSKWSRREEEKRAVAMEVEESGEVS